MKRPRDELRVRTRLARQALSMLIVVALVAITPTVRGESLSSAFAIESTERPRLVLQITIDQLRADMISDDAAGLGSDGFRRLIRSGSVFLDAHHEHTNTETAAGHAALATGARASKHGMVSNLWISREDGRRVYAVEDDDYLILPTRDPSDDRTANSDGRSPRNLLSETVADVIRKEIGPDAKIFSVSGKDRAAVIMGGQSGVAYWYSKYAGAMVTSSYYMEAYPDWAASWNRADFFERYRATPWTLRDRPETYEHIQSDDRPFERVHGAFGRTFPHELADLDDRAFRGVIRITPFLDELVMDFALTLAHEEEVGQDDITDYLSISLSATDYIGHCFGPKSLEAEDNLRRLDDLISLMLDEIDGLIGLEHVLIVLSSDHGIPESPGSRLLKNLPAGEIRPDLIENAAIFALDHFYGDGRELMLGTYVDQVTLDRDRLQSRGIDLHEAQRVAAIGIGQLEGVEVVYTSKDFDERRSLRADIDRIARRAHHPERSGDLQVILREHWVIFSGHHDAVNHGSPWTYDTHVPLIFAGWRIMPASSGAFVRTIDAPATMCRLIDVRTPADSTGTALSVPVLDIER